MDIIWCSRQSIRCLTSGYDRIYCYKKKEAPLPSVDLPVGPYTSYKVSVSDEGYAISYSANDPKTAFITKDIKEKGGFLGLAN